MSDDDITNPTKHPNQTNQTMNAAAETTINGLPATHVRIKTADGECSTIKVLFVPEFPDTANPNPVPNPDHRQLITQYRCGNIALTSRTIDPALYTNDQIEWFADPDPKIPEPMRLVMIEMLRCYLCGDRQCASGESDSSDAIYSESAGEHSYGYLMCIECKLYFRTALFKQIAPIWRFRLRHEAAHANNNYTRVPVWVARTRYDDNGVRVRSGPMPYKYSQWTVVQWVTTKYHDKYKADHDPAYSGDTCVMVESLVEPLIKLAPVPDLFIINYGSIADPAYDPNVDDPMNRYSVDEKARLLAEAISNTSFE